MKRTVKFDPKMPWLPKVTGTLMKKEDCRKFYQENKDKKTPEAMGNMVELINTLVAMEKPNKQAIKAVAQHMARNITKDFQYPGMCLVADAYVARAYYQLNDRKPELGRADYLVAKSEKVFLNEKEDLKSIIDYDALYIGQGEYGVSKDKNIGTDVVGNCVCLIVRNTDTKETFLAHIDNSIDEPSVTKAIKALFPNDNPKNKDIQNFEVIAFGAKDKESESSEDSEDSKEKKGEKNFKTLQKVLKNTGLDKLHELDKKKISVNCREDSIYTQVVFNPESRTPYYDKIPGQREKEYISNTRMFLNSNLTKGRLRCAVDARNRFNQNNSDYVPLTPEELLLIRQNPIGETFLEPGKSRERIILESLKVKKVIRQSIQVKKINLPQQFSYKSGGILKELSPKATEELKKIKKTVSTDNTQERIPRIHSQPYTEGPYVKKGAGFMIKKTTNSKNNSPKL